MRQPSKLLCILSLLLSVSTWAAGAIYSTDLLRSPYSNWGVSPDNSKASINLNEAWKQFSKKKEVVVAVVDTGIDPTHPHLSKNLYSFEGKIGIESYGKDFSKGATNVNKPFDQHGHGTHVSGIIKTIFPDVKIIALKYYNKNASGQDNLNSTIEALRYAVSKQVDIINYSGGGPEASLEELRILKEAEKKGIIVVAAAGNEESNIDKKNSAYYPASYRLDNIINVAAYDQDLKLISLSNYGKDSVDIAAPGYRITSTYPDGRAGALSGTSQATAFVTGVVALLKSKYPELNMQEIKQVIRDSAEKIPAFKEKLISEGKLDANSAFTLAAKILSEKRNRRGIATSPKEGTIFYSIKK